jgi:hypothetical protein
MMECLVSCLDRIFDIRCLGCYPRKASAIARINGLKNATRFGRHPSSPMKRLIGFCARNRSTSGSIGVAIAEAIDTSCGSVIGMGDRDDQNEDPFLRAQRDELSTWHFIHVRNMTRQELC